MVIVGVQSGLLVPTRVSLAAHYNREKCGEDGIRALMVELQF
jgi:hypothetical protein